MRSKRTMLIAGVILGAFIGAFVCSGPFLYFAPSIGSLGDILPVFVFSLVFGAVIGALAGGTSGIMLAWIGEHVHKNMLIAGIILSAFVGAIACSGPFLLASFEDPEYWGEISIETMALLVVIGAVIGALSGGVSGSLLSWMGGRIGMAVSIESGETVGVFLGILVGAAIGGVVTLGLAIIGLGIIA